MATRNTQKAFYAWGIVYDWIVGKMCDWEIQSFSSFVNHLVMMWIVLERHNLLDSVLKKAAILEGFTTSEELRRSLCSRYSFTVVTKTSDSKTETKGLSTKV